MTSTMSPHTSVSYDAKPYVDIVKEKREKRLRIPKAEQRAREEAHKLRCTASPMTTGQLAQHCFGDDSSRCAFCNETPTGILNTSLEIFA